MDKIGKPGTTHLAQGRLLTRGPVHSAEQCVLQVDIQGYFCWSLLDNWCALCLALFMI